MLLYWKLKKAAMLHLLHLPENSTLQGAELDNPLQLALEKRSATVNREVIAENPLSTKEPFSSTEASKRL